LVLWSARGRVLLQRRPGLSAADRRGRAL